MCYLIGYGTSTMPGDLKFKRMPKNYVCELAIFCLPQQEPQHEAAQIPLQGPARKLRQSIQKLRHSSEQTDRHNPDGQQLFRGTYHQSASE